MKSMLFILIVSTIMSSSAVAGRALPQDQAVESQILQFVTSVHSFAFGSISGKVIVTSSFAEPDEVAYLVLAKTSDFDSEEQNASVYNLDSVLGMNATIEKVEKKGSSLVFTTAELDSGKMKKVVIHIRKLSASL